jgi:hypothetical protein
MKTVPRSFAAKDAARSSKASKRVSARYGTASKKDSLFKCAVRRAQNVASLTMLAAFTSSHSVVIVFTKLL